MKRTILAAGGATLAAVVLVALASSGREAARAQAVNRGHFLEVGKLYTFGWPGNTTANHCKVLEGPHGDWVKVSVPGEHKDKPLVAWINLSKFEAIVPE